MLIKRRCPHTGVINIFSRSEPHMAVGSIVSGDDHQITWRYYAEPYVRAGHTEDMREAENVVRKISRLATDGPDVVVRPC